MSLSRDDVTRVARLARLGLSDAEADRALTDLNAILDLVDAMATVDTTGVTPIGHPLEATQVLRADQVTDIDARDALMANAPAKADGLFLVPRVVE
jgi:aspartyl-tRNA(Asn)/glutamyl-tRNA(Gln) amidotransferase subunit C